MTSENPAEAIERFITDKEHGLGEPLTPKDKEAIAEIANYCAARAENPAAVMTGSQLRDHARRRASTMFIDETVGGALCVFHNPNLPPDLEMDNFQYLMRADGRNREHGVLAVMEEALTALHEGTCLAPHKTRDTRGTDEEADILRLEFRWSEPEMAAAADRQLLPSRHPRSARLAQLIVWESRIQAGEPWDQIRWEGLQ